MSNKWQLTDASGSGQLDKHSTTGGANKQPQLWKSMVHLSDGTLVFAVQDTVAGTLKLYYSTARSSVTLIDSVSHTTFGGSTNLDPVGQPIVLIRDASNNLYLVGAGVSGGGSASAVVAYTKGSGYTWTRQTQYIIQTATASGSPNVYGLDAVWCNTGNGTNSAGTILCWFEFEDTGPVYIYQCFTLDAGTLLNSTYSTMGGAWTAPTVAGNGTTAMLSAAGYGATSGVFVFYNNGTNPTYGACAAPFTVSSPTSVIFGTGFSLGASYFPSLNVGRVPVVYVGSGKWVYLGPTSLSLPANIAAVAFTSSALVTSATSPGAVTGWPTLPYNTNATWDATYDWGAGKIWLYALSSVTNTTMVRLGLSPGGGGLTYDGAITTDDTSVLPSSPPDTWSIQCIHDVVSLAFADYSITYTSGTSGNYVNTVNGDYSQLVQAPLAPTLTAPTPSTAVDFSSGYTFTWTYNPGPGSGTQNAYSFRRKNSHAASTVNNVAGNGTTATLTTSAGHGLTVNDCVTVAGLTHTGFNGTYIVTAVTTNTFSYANGTSQASTADSGSATPAYGYYTGSGWSTSQQWVSTSVQSVAFGSTAFADGATYGWSVATQENVLNLQGPFAGDASVLGQAAPTVTVTAPSGTASQLPTVTWTESLASSCSQIAYRVLIYPASVIAGGGFVAGTTAGWASDTGVVSSAALQAATSSLLAVGTSYTAYVQITQTGPQTSAWTAGSSFTVTSVMATPTLTASYDSTNNRILVTVQARDNLLSANAASVETDATAWTAGSNTTATQSNTVALNGSYSLRLDPTAAGNMSASTATGTSGVAVTANSQYTALASFFRNSSTARSCTVAIFWYQSSGAASAHPSDTSGSITDTTWTQASLTVTSPADAAYAAIVVTVASTGAAHEYHYADQMSLAPGALTTWTIGGLDPTENAVVQASTVSSSGPWTTIRGAAILSLNTYNTGSAYDYEEPAGTVYYQAYTTSTGTGTLTTSAAATATVMVAMVQWWLKDPLNTTVNAPFNVQTQDTSITERHTGFQVLGDVYQVVVTDVVEAPAGTITVLTYTPSDYANLLGFINGQRVYLLQSPFGEQWYVRLMQDRKSNLAPSTLTAPWRTTTLNFVSQPTP